MYVFLEEGTRRARKVHQCGPCGRVIEAGQRYRYQSYIGVDGPQTWKAHLWCGMLDGLAQSDCWNYYHEYAPPESVIEWAEATEHQGDCQGIIAYGFMERIRG